VANLVGDANLRAIYTPPSDQEPDDLVGIHPNGTHVVTAIRPIGYKEGKGPSTLVRIKISDGTSENLCTQQFYLNHAHYSRNDPNWIAFSRDSSSDRMWAWHATLAPNGKAMWDGKFEGQQQAVGHEVWTPHNRTSGIAVAYPGTSKNGIYEVRTDGTVSLVKAGGFWHLNTSYDNAWLAYDQTGGGVGVIERSTGTVTQLATTGSGSHPKHPHPHLSRYATVLVYNDTNSDGQVRVVALKFR
jgi:hypothetical protein